jgi:CubicO group peptidase (beta-lactamase class C family)
VRVKVVALGASLRQTMRILGRSHKRIRAFPSSSVSTRSDREVDPRSVGLRAEDVEAIWSAVVGFYETCLHPALGLCIRRRGEVILDRTIGHVRGNSPKDDDDAELVVATPDTLFSFFSGSKVVTATLVHILADREQLRVDDPVAKFIPEFGRHQKHQITIRQLLSHSAGIPDVPPELLELEMLETPDRILNAIYDLEPRFRPGTVPAYHTLTSGFVLAELIQRVAGMGIREFLAKEIGEPLGMRHFNYGVAEDELDDVAVDAFTGPKPGWLVKQTIEKALGISLPKLVDTINDPRFRTGVVPSANIIGTTNEISRFFDMLVNGGVYDGQRILSSSAIAKAIEPQSPGRFDRIIKIPMAYSMGFMLGNDPVGFYGPWSGRAFGHIGLMNIMGWADPERDLAVALTNTGKPMPSIDTIRWFEILRRINTRVPRDGAGPLRQLH